MAAIESTVNNLLASLGWSIRAGELAAATAAAAGGTPGPLRDLITALQNRVAAAAAGPAPVPDTATALLADAEQKPAGEATQLAHVLKVDRRRLTR